EHLHRQGPPVSSRGPLAGPTDYARRRPAVPAPAAGPRGSTFWGYLPRLPLGRAVGSPFVCKALTPPVAPNPPPLPRIFTPRPPPPAPPRQNEERRPLEIVPDLFSGDRGSVAGYK